MNDDLISIDVAISELTNEGVDIFLNKLLHLTEGTINNWSVIGEFIEKYNVELSPPNEIGELWTSSMSDGPSFVQGTSPCVSVGRLVAEKMVSEAARGTYVLRLPFNTAVELIEDGGEENLGMIVATGRQTKPDEIVELVLHADC